MTILVATHPAFERHDTGPGHPERPERLMAVRRGLEASGVRDAFVYIEAEPAPLEAIQAVHPGRYVQALSELTAAGGGWIDGDTVVVEESYEAALLAAGAGLDVARRLQAGEADAGFCAIRPPGHHATPTRSMGFCLLNNVAVTARYLASAGDRVLIVDYDAHHGNGTQDVFWADPQVVYVSLHEYPLYPGTGAMDETGDGAGAGATINFPLPAGATGDVYRRAFDEVLAEQLERWKPDWLLLSAGFDGHTRDPLTGLGLAAGDFADMTRWLQRFVPPGRTIAFLEGGYDLEALTNSVASSVAALVDVNTRPEPATSGGPGAHVVDAVLRRRELLMVDPLPKPVAAPTPAPKASPATSADERRGAGEGTTSPASGH
ncbi:MAG: histone deacetylase [Acidimicrobiia bacterium]|nr:histone deacetylase [Acidimicrobiia bacterium]